MEKAVEFTKVMESSKKSIDVVLDSETSAIIEDNRKRLRPIVKTIVFCARNNLPLRGHRDHGLISQLKEESNEDLLVGKHGVFQSLLAFRVDAGDEDLKRHFAICRRNSAMISNTVQNEIIDCIGETFRSSISEDVKRSKFFSIMCDETTDVSTKEQMTFCVRYIDTQSFVTKEEFVGFTEMTETTGVAIKEAIDKELDALGLTKEHLCGQGYDGGSNMAGKFKGVQALISNEQPMAIYSHCFSHSLNLVISKSCDIPAIRNMLGTVGAVTTFLSASALRKNALEEVINQLPEIKKKSLKVMCPTRWVERHDSLIRFKELFLPIVTLLDQLSTSPDTNSETSSKASMLSSAIQKGEFIIALETTAYCMAITLRLSEQLQNPQLDFGNALQNINCILEVFRNLRRTVDVEFGSIFEDALQKASEIECEIRIPRKCFRQTHRENTDASNPEEYYRRMVFLPLVDHLIQELESRFSQRLVDILPLEGLVPKNILKYEEEEILKAAKNYQQYLDGSELILKSEIKLWKNKWDSEIEPPYTAVEALKKCDQQFFPNIFILLQIFGTIPVTTSTPERSFSTLRRIKTYLRSTMGQARLNGLALANIQKDRKISIEDVINIFSRKKARRMKIANWNV